LASVIAAVKVLILRSRRG